MLIKLDNPVKRYTEVAEKLSSKDILTVKSTINFMQSLHHISIQNTSDFLMARAMTIRLFKFSSECITDLLNSLTKILKFINNINTNSCLNAGMFEVLVLLLGKNYECLEVSFLIIIILGELSHGINMVYHKLDIEIIHSLLYLTRKFDPNVQVSIMKIIYNIAKLEHNCNILITCDVIGFIKESLSESSIIQQNAAELFEVVSIKKKFCEYFVMSNIMDDIVDILKDGDNFTKKKLLSGLWSISIISPKIFITHKTMKVLSKIYQVYY